jgi:predicted flap endonuclease-1-like 5' DNA nuclease
MALFWAFGGCFRPVAYLIWLFASACGVGAALVHWLKLGRSPEAVNPPPTPPTPQEPTSPPVVVPAERAPVEAPAADFAAAEATSPTVSTEPAAAITSMESPTAENPVNTATPEIDPAIPASVADDFTVIKGIGPTFDQRLKAAGIHTFAQLAAMTPEQVAVIIGWTPQRVLADDLLGQAKVLSTGWRG